MYIKLFLPEKKRVQISPILLLMFLFVISCSNESTSTSKSDANKYDASLVDQAYQRMCWKEKGTDFYFIPKDDVEAILKDGDPKKNIPISGAQEGDIVFFYDSIGDVVYQAEISEIENSKVYIDCVDLKTFSKYRTELNVDSVKDLNINSKYQIKVYR
jgi:hypothetical protein